MPETNLRVLVNGVPREISALQFLAALLPLVPVVMADGSSSIIDALNRLLIGLASPVPPRRFRAADGNLSAGQTAFTIPGGYTPGLATVYRNGLIVATADYTATNGTSITLVDPVAADDIIDVRALRSGGALNVMPAPHTHSVQDLTDATNAWFESLYDRWLASLPVYSGDGPAPVPAGRYYNNNGRPEKAQ